MTLGQSIAEENGTYIVDEPFARIETVTPELAERWLKNMASNRKLSEPHVGKFVRDMEADRWKVSPQGIGFSTTGELVDGQHRLQAVLRSEKTVRMLVVRDLAPDIISAIDENRKRSFGDDLHMDGQGNSSTLAAAILLIHRMQIGAGRNLKVSMLNHLAFSRYELHDVKAQLESDGDVANAVRNGLHLRSAIDVPPSAGSAAYYIASRQYGEDFVSEAYDRLCTGRDLGAESPLLTGRERFIKLNLTRPKPLGHIYAAAILRVLQAEQRGESLKKMLLTSIEAMRVRRLM